MTKISRYVIDDKVTGSDKWIGSDAQTQYTTKNFTPTKLAVYFNENQVIDIGTPIRYRYDILEVGDTRLPGTITFEPQVGTPYSLASISSFILSKYTLKGNDVTQYLNFLIGSNVLIYKADDINIFGLYKVVSLVENIDEPDFFDVVVSYTTGNGSIVEDKDYLVSLIDIPGGDIPTKTSDLINDGEDGVHPFITLEDIPTPNLNDVLLEGNISELDAKIGELYLFDTSTGAYAKMSVSDQVFELGRAGGGTMLTVDNGNNLVLNNGIAAAQINNNLLVSRNYTLPDASGTIALTSDIPTQGLTSVGLTMPVAFNVANSPLTSDGTIAVSAAGTSSQYIRGDGQLATLPTGGGGGSSVNYYLNGSIAANVVGYKQLSNVAIVGAGTDFPLTGDGLITQFLSDVGNPNRIQIPGGAWNFEMWFSMSSNGGTPKFYVELLKYNGSIFTSIASTITVPESITGGTNIDLYLTSLAVPTTTLLSTDRLAIRVYIVDNSGGRTVTLHTEDNHLCEVLTTFSGGVTSLNGLTANTQYLAVGTTGTDFNIDSLTDTHTFNLPTASATNRGALSSTDWTAFNGKFTLPALTSGSVLFSNGTTIAQDNANFFWDDTNNRLGIGTTTPTANLHIKAYGALATDIPFKIRNSVDNLDLMSVNGDGIVSINRNSSSSSNSLSIINTSTTGSNFIKIGQNSDNSSLGFGWYPSSSGTYRDLIANTAYMYALSGASQMAFNTTTSSQPIIFCTNDWNERMRVNGIGNVLIGTKIDQGGKLQIKAPGALSTDIALRVRNSADSADIFTVRGNGTSELSSSLAVGGNITANSVLFGQTLVLNSTNPIISGGAIVFQNTITNVANSQKIINLTPTYNQASGTASNTDIFLNRTTTAVGSGTQLLMDLQHNSVSQFRVGTNGNTLINTTVDQGGKLQIKAPGALSTDIALRVRNSADSGDLMTVAGDGGVIIGGVTKITSSASILTIFRPDGTGAAFQPANGVNTAYGEFRWKDAGGTDLARMLATGNLLLGTITNIASSKLTIASTTQGFLPPRMTNAQRLLIATPAVGLCVYCTDVVEGLYINKSTGWTYIG